MKIDERRNSGSKCFVEQQIGREIRISRDEKPCILNFSLEFEVHVKVLNNCSKKVCKVLSMNTKCRFLLLQCMLMLAMVIACL